MGGERRVEQIRLVAARHEYVFRLGRENVGRGGVGGRRLEAGAGRAAVRGERGERIRRVDGDCRRLVIRLVSAEIQERILPAARCPRSVAEILEERIGRLARHVVVRLDPVVVVHQERVPSFRIHVGSSVVEFRGEDETEASFKGGSKGAKEEKEEGKEEIIDIL